MLRVSIVIPTHNHARFVTLAIESALAQTQPASEIIVVDDGSSDDTPSVLAPYAGRITVVRQQKQGVAAARNAGAKLATGDLLGFLDADDVWLPAKLERQVARFVSAPHIGLVHCGLETIDGAGEPLVRSVHGLEGSVADEFLFFRRPLILGGGSGAVIPRAVFNEVGGFDEQMSTSADWDLYYRIARRYEVGFVPEVLLKYRLHPGNMHGNIRAMERDMLLGYAKAFRSADSRLRSIRRRAYGNLHSVLAGSFFSAGQYTGFIKHTLMSLLLTPGNIGQFAGYPLRRWRRSKLASGDPSSRRGAAPEAAR
jgi:glycosyltransferase involved in cell wall biosynthesis